VAIPAIVVHSNSPTGSRAETQSQPEGDDCCQGNGGSENRLLNRNAQKGKLQIKMLRQNPTNRLR
jgi:hypothetical protein